MDALSSKLFAKRQVKIIYASNFDAIAALEQKFFGRSLDFMDYAEIMGAPDDSEIAVAVEVTDYGILLDIDVRQQLLGLIIRSTLQEVDGDITLFCHDFHVGDAAQPGIATRIIARQAVQARRRGIKEIMLLAAGGPQQSLVGYYVWPRLGFTIDLRSSRTTLDAAGFRQVDTTNDLFRQPDGARWWREHGFADFATLDLRTGADSFRLLTAYLSREGIEANDEN